MSGDHFAASLHIFALTGFKGALQPLRALDASSSVLRQLQHGVVRQPVMICTATHDFPELRAQTPTEALPHLLRMEGLEAGHWMHIEQPVALAAALRDFSHDVDYFYSTVTNEHTHTLYKAAVPTDKHRQQWDEHAALLHSEL